MEMKLEQKEGTSSKKNKLCVLCPSRGRSLLLKRMLDSYEKHSVQSDIVFAFQGNDPELQKNTAIVKGKYPDKYWIMGNIGFVNKVNKLVELYPGYAAYMILNDDQIIHTPEWDKLLLDKLDELEKEYGHRCWIIYWKDGINDEKLPQSFATSEFLRAVGTYYPKGYMRHLYTDNMYKWIGEQCDILHYMPNIYIEHLHFINKKAELDDNYKESNNKNNYKSDGMQYDRWLKEKGPETIARLKHRIKVTKVIKNKMDIVFKKMNFPLSYFEGQHNDKYIAGYQFNGFNVICMPGSTKKEATDNLVEFIL